MQLMKKNLAYKFVEHSYTVKTPATLLVAGVHSMITLFLYIFWQSSIIITINDSSCRIPNIFY